MKHALILASLLMTQSAFAASRPTLNYNPADPKMSQAASSSKPCTRGSMSQGTTADSRRIHTESAVYTAPAKAFPKGHLI